MLLMACRVETYDSADVPKSANEALGKPALNTLVAHDLWCSLDAHLSDSSPVHRSKQVDTLLKMRAITE